MTDSLYIAATGMQTQQEALNVISNNLANVNTPGYKKSKISFVDLMYRDANSAQALSSNGNEIYQMGSGSAVAGVSKTFSMGDIKASERQLDVAINGEGLFEVNLLDGSKAYTRSGSLSVSADGYLATNNGYQLSTQIQVPDGTTSMVITTDGNVKAAVQGESGLISIGQIELAHFVSTENLKPLGNNLYLPTAESGDAMVGRPGEDNLGNIQQGFLESSNVNLIDELVTMMLTQRAFEINSKVIQVSDEIMSLSNNMRR